MSAFPVIQIIHITELKANYLSALIHLSAFPVIQIIHLSVTKVIFQVHQYTWVYFNSYKYNCNTLHGVFKVNFLSALIHLSEFPDIQIKHFIEYSKWIFVSALIHLSAFPLIQIIHLTKLKVNFFKRINTLECIPGHTNNTPYNIKSEFLSALIHLSAFSVIQMIHFMKCWKWIL